MSTQKSASAWLTLMQHKAQETPSGAFIVQDEQKRQILFEWKLTNILSPECSEVKKQVVDLACAELVPTELSFLKTHPQAVTRDGFLRSCAPFFANGKDNVDWVACSKAIDTTLRTIYTADVREFGEAIVKRLEQDVFLFVTAKDFATDELLGFVSCGVTPASGLGDVKIISCVVSVQHQDRNLERMLLSAIFKVVPEAQRLLVGVRPTSAYMIDVYEACGFEKNTSLAQDKNHPIDMNNWALFAYDVVKGVL